jgi:hypothetical protein
MVIKESAELTDSETYKDTYVPAGVILTIGAGVTLTIAAGSTLDIKGTLADNSGTKVIATATGAKILDKNANVITTTSGGATSAGIAALLGQLNGASVSDLIIPVNATLTVPVSLTATGTVTVNGNIIVDGIFTATGDIVGDGIVKTGTDGKIVDLDADYFYITTSTEGITGENLNICLGIFTGGEAGTYELPANAILNVVGIVAIPTRQTLTVAAGAEIVIEENGEITLIVGDFGGGGIVFRSAAPGGAGAKLSFAANTDRAELVSTDYMRIGANGAAVTIPAEAVVNLPQYLPIKSIQAGSTEENANIQIVGSENSGELRTATTFGPLIPTGD